MPGITLRPARPEDAPALAAILVDWIDRTDWMPRLHSREDDARFVASLVARDIVTVAVQADAPQGFLAREGAEIPALYIAHAARRQGLGATLIAAAQEASPVLGLWTFQANTQARRFYTRMGFVEEKCTEGENEEGLPDIYLSWRE